VSNPGSLIRSVIETWVRCMAVTSVLDRSELEADLGYAERSCLKNT
jgi:hypothetical protein